MLAKQVSWPECVLKKYIYIYLLQANYLSTIMALSLKCNQILSFKAFPVTYDFFLFVMEK